jgi:hypothetical protein
MTYTLIFSGLQLNFGGLLIHLMNLRMASQTRGLSIKEWRIWKRLAIALLPQFEIYPSIFYILLIPVWSLDCFFRVQNINVRPFLKG